MKQKAIIAACLALCLLSAEAADVSVFGLPAFGSVFKLPRCKMKEYDPIKPKAGACYSDPIVGPSTYGKSRFAYITFPAREDPEIVRGDASARIVGGKFEGLSFHTKGLENAPSIIDQLVLKFGPATNIAKGKFKTDHGQYIDYIRASWVLADVDIVFDTPYGYDVTTGQVVIKSRKLADDDQTRKKAAEASKHPRPL